MYIIRVSRKLLKFTGRFLFALMLCVCMVMGVAPVLPKRKEQFAIEIKAEQTDKTENDTTTTAQL